MTLHNNHSKIILLELRLFVRERYRLLIHIAVVASKYMRLYKLYVYVQHWYIELKTSLVLEIWLKTILIDIIGHQKYGYIKYFLCTSEYENSNPLTNNTFG
jgi:hypothetical protein